MIHPDTQVKHINKNIGLGVFATRFIPIGTIVYVQDKLERILLRDDPLIYNTDYYETIEKYSFTDKNGNRVISWDHAKYVNHNCNANTLCTGWEFDVTVTDIVPGQELSCDYGLLNIEKEMACVCGELNCRLLIKPSDIDQFAGKWNVKIKKVLENLPKVEQPLQKYFSAELVNDVLHFLLTGEGYKSVSALKYTANISESK
ncbi:MAG: SET domain-containing protein [Bacteroidota bacterium]